LSREKEADRRLEKMARKGGRLVTLRAKVKSVTDENHAYQAEVNLLQSLQHNANQQNASVENDIERLVNKVTLVLTAPHSTT
jgi:chromosome segregation ATPase